MNDGPVLAFLQNTWVNDPPRCQEVLDGCEAPAERRYMTSAWLFMGCTTGRRLKQAFGEDGVYDIVWDNASPKLAGASSGSFPPDPDHIRAVIEEVKPAVVLAFGRVAENGVRTLWDGPFIVGPHPTARGDVWRGIFRMAEELAAWRSGVELEKAERG
jgi:hypothetical protein